jgi:hypothetical protein
MLMSNELRMSWLMRGTAMASAPARVALYLRRCIGYLSLICGKVCLPHRVEECHEQASFAIHCLVQIER